MHGDDTRSVDARLHHQPGGGAQRVKLVAIGGFELHVLPVLMSGAMFFTSKMTMKDPKQAALVYIMPIVMVFIMWNFSSGLVLYWTVFNVMQIGQQVLTNHMRGKKLRSGFADILTPGH